MVGCLGTCWSTAFIVTAFITVAFLCFRIPIPIILFANGRVTTVALHCAAVCVIPQGHSITLPKKPSESAMWLISGRYVMQNFRNRRTNCSSSGVRVIRRPPFVNARNGRTYQPQRTSNPSKAVQQRSCHKVRSVPASTSA